MSPKTLLLTLTALALLGGTIFFLTLPKPEAPALPEQPAGPPAPLSYEDGGEYYTITASYPSEIMLSESASAASRASAKAVIDAWVRETAQTFKTNSNLDGLSEEDVRIQGLGDGRKYELAATYETYESATTVSYLFEIYEDTLGAHPNAYYRSFTFDKANGKELRIADLFENSSYLEMLSRLSRERLVPQIASTSGVPEDELDTSMIDAGTGSDPNNFQVFYLNETDLVIVFPPYQVGPWVLGTQTVSIPRTELSGVIKGQYR